jgi:SAM-dependent methyltransferase
VRVQGQDDWNPEGPARGLAFQVRRCVSCLACFTSPRFREAWKQLPFQGGYPFYERARATRQAPGAAAMRAFAPRADRLQRAHPVPGRLLDLGMGDGAFLALMQARGWTVSGLDIEPDVVAFAKAHLGVEDCQALDVERDPLPPGPFDAVTLWGVLQLAYRPRVLLEKVRAVLAPGGVLAIGVANIEGAGPRLFGEHWQGLGLPRHLVHFGPDSLQRLVREAGFQVVELGFATPYWIAAGSMRARLPLPGLAGGLLRRGAGALLGALGRTRLGDTLTLLAK